MNNPTPEILVREWAWKTPAMKEMTLAVCEIALRHGLQEFSALDLPEHGADAHGGTGIAGSVFRLLADAGIIAPVGTFIDGEFYQKRVRNAGGNPIGQWRLAHRGLAEALIAVHGGRAAGQEQLELIAE